MKITVIATSSLLWFTPGKQEKNVLNIDENDSLQSVLDQLNIPIDEVSYVVCNGKIYGLDYRPRVDDMIELYPVIYSG